MDRGHLQNSDLNRSHEPVGIPLNRPPGTFSPTVGEGRDEGVRFMESLLSLLRTHWDHEPLRLTEARSGPRVCDPQPARFMESLLARTTAHASCLFSAIRLSISLRVLAP